MFVRRENRQNNKLIFVELCWECVFIAKSVPNERSVTVKTKPNRKKTKKRNNGMPFGTFVFCHFLMLHSKIVYSSSFSPYVFFFLKQTWREKKRYFPFSFRIASGIHVLLLLLLRLLLLMLRADIFIYCWNIKINKNDDDNNKSWNHCVLSKLSISCSPSCFLPLNSSEKHCVK